MLKMLGLCVCVLNMSFLFFVCSSILFWISHGQFKIFEFQGSFFCFMFQEIRTHTHNYIHKGELYLYLWTCDWGNEISLLSLYFSLHVVNTRQWSIKLYIFILKKYITTLIILLLFFQFFLLYYLVFYFFFVFLSSTRIAEFRSSQPAWDLYFFISSPRLRARCICYNNKQIVF
jgi:hypothetical protein